MRQSATARSLIATLVSAALAGTIALVGPAMPASAAAAPSITQLRTKIIYLQGKGDSDARDAAVGGLIEQSAWQGKAWQGFVTEWSKVTAGMKMNTAVPSGLPTKNHVFVVLGSALTSSGNVSTKLERRLKLALKALQAYPNAKVVVSGGAPRNGVTEAAAMQAWLLDKGVAKDRIIAETKSSSTVGNARYSMEILAGLGGFTSYTVVTDSSHIRRASVLFLAAKLRVEEQQGKNWAIKPIANLVFPDLATAGQKPLSASSSAYAASNVAGVFGLTSQYNALVAEPPIPAKVASIDVTNPTKLVYGVGESLSTAGLLVKVVYDDGSRRDVTRSAKLTGFSSAKLGAGSVTVSYTEDGQTASASFAYKVTTKVASTAKITLGATKAKLLKSKVAVNVKIASGSVKPTGKVSLYLDGKLVRTTTLKAKAAGVATFTFAFNKVGVRKFTVVYSGDSLTASAEGKAVKLTVTK